ncbi:MAG: tRNA (adenosine(37)-N6)-threonylcarbamoyltransferase complex dimerization subunit type 1 TsaB [Streptococcaceae bacterium]|jgi:tRNA threonylcarbamoyl adenosine modification protein YeaZ|nr:tRNA (adenosine(37)-N6)-threonylcarbamoyltransferase complex dimerization subunit type 1 TsaB [Streptococcaceae bacterium]
MKLLALDTSGKATALALMQDDQLLVEKNFVDSENHSVSLMPTIAEIMTAIGWTPQDLTRVAVAQGPGSYTGLRIAVTAAKTLAYTLGLELVGVSSLQVLIPLETKGTVVSLMNARRGFVYAGIYENDKVMAPDKHLALTDLLATCSGTETFVGETALFEGEIRNKFPKAKIQETQPTGKVLARQGAKGVAVVGDAIHNFNPRYLKKVEAEEKWEANNGDFIADSDLVQQV